MAAVEAFARDYHETMRGKWIAVEALAGFCLLIRREAMESIRPALRQWTELSLFQTDIASKKARQEGFQLGGVPGFLRAPFRDADVCARGGGGR